MAKLKRSFSRGVMNKDIDERLLPDGMYLDALNVDVMNAEGSDAGSVRNIKGNTEVGDLGNAAGAAAVNATTIGAVTSDKDNRIYWLVTSDNYDGIYEYDEDTGTTVRVLQSSTGQLAFDPDYHVTGINIIDGFLYWTDNLNPPRRVNISFVKGFAIDDARIDEYINVILAPPLRAPFIEMQTEDNNETNMEDKFLQFAYRYKYRDNQYSALSPFSAVAFVPGTYSFDYGAGNNEAMLNTKNKVDVTFETGGKFVEEIQVVVRDTKSLNVSIVETFKKSQTTPTFNYNASPDLLSYSTHTFTFKNNKIYTPLAADQVTRLFDNVPVKAKSQEIIDRRLIYGNYTQFYDIVNCDGSDLLIDYEVGYTEEETTSGTAIQSFRSDRDYEIAIQYGDNYGRFTTALTPSENESTVYIPPTASVTGNSLQVSINSKAPCFATHYRLMIKESKKSYYNVFPILYYVDGIYRYFLINQSDKNKFSEGDYLIFKSDASGATLSNKKYKVLEIKSQPKDFLDGDEISGLYFKIKVAQGEFTLSDLFTADYNGIGAGTALKWPWGIEAAPDAITDLFSCVESPIFYGTGVNDLATTLTYTGEKDRRYTIEIDSINPVTFKYTTSLDLGSWIEEGVAVTTSATPLNHFDPNLSSDISVYFGGTTSHEVGDKWVVMLRGMASNGEKWTSVEFANFEMHQAEQNNTGGWDTGADTPIAIVPTNITTDLAINVGAVIRLELEETYGDGGSWSDELEFSPSPNNYDNIEEWWYESGARDDYSFTLQNGNIANSAKVSFRRGTDYQLSNGNNSDPDANTMSQGGSWTPVTAAYPVRMIIQGSAGASQDGSLTQQAVQSVLKATLKITQQDTPTLCETEPLEVDDQIFHEIPRTFTISNQQHEVLWKYTDYTSVDGGARTRLGMAAPTTDIPTSSDIPHYFHVGDTVWITSDDPAYGPSALVAHTVDEVENPYNIIISTAFPGAGPVTGGGISLAEIEQDQDTPTTPAIIKINNPDNPNSTFNAYSFGNGLESDRIRDDFNETELQYSPRASAVIDNYEQETKEASVCYSGVYKGDTSINRLNEFNLSKGNFKNLDREFGSIQKLFARDTNILVMQEDKVSQIMYGKNIMYDSVGGGTVTSVPEVLGTQSSYAGEYGISFNPESFANWGNDVFWTDERRGSVLMMTSGQIVDISEKGMKDYFRDLFRDNPKTQKLGVYDPYRHQYIIASNEDDAVPCDFNLSLSGNTYPATNPGLEEINDERPDFYVYSNTSWTVSIVYSAGTNWVSGYPVSGFGDQAIYLGIGDNLTSALRTATLTFTYCSGQTETFVVTQSRGEKITIRPIIVHNGNFTKF